MNKKITICHLYPDLMNIYGDRGNIIALTKRLEWRGIEFEVIEKSVGDQLVAGEIDVYFFGGGQDRAQVVVAKDLTNKAKVIKTDVENGVGMLAICGGYQLFGKYYLDQTGDRLEGIGIFDAVTKASNKRMIGNILVETTEIVGGVEIIGFENHSGQTFLGEGMKPLGKVIKGFGNNGEDGTEGVVYKNAIGTYLHGSLLPKNPKLADFILSKALMRKYPEFKLDLLDDELERVAFAEAKGRF